MRADAPRELSVLGMVAGLGAIFLGGWLAWCAAFQFGGVVTEAEIISTQVERRSRRSSTTYAVVRYADQAGKPHADKVLLYVSEAVGSKIAIRYLPSRPDDCYRDDFWGIWGLAVMVSGVFALFVGLMWYVERKRLQNAPRPNPFDQATP
ncbi:MAG: DUF3592 domain-containing protein [Opitutales bacterium]|nr:DUF3592 domain-containing protein [Opitutales bacterium]